MSARQAREVLEDWGESPIHPRGGFGRAVVVIIVVVPSQILAFSSSPVDVGLPLEVEVEVQPDSPARSACSSR